MASADVSKVPGEQKAILGSLNNLFNACMPLANTPGARVWRLSRCWGADVRMMCTAERVVSKAAAAL
jgi:hypothetical protein